MQEDIRQDGVDPDSLNRVTTNSMAENCAALAAGEIDVIQIFEPYVSQMEMAGTGHVWHAAASRGPTAYTTFMTTTANMVEYAPEFRAMLRGLQNPGLAARRPGCRGGTNRAALLPRHGPGAVRALRGPLPPAEYLGPQPGIPGRTLGAAGTRHVHRRGDQAEARLGCRRR